MKNYIWITILVVLLIFTSSFLLFDISNHKEQCYRPELSVIGDVSNVLSLHSYQDLDTININYKDQILEVIKLTDVINRSIPAADNYNVVFSAVDGLQALIPGKNLDECYINFSSRNGWEAININHPVSSNVKYIKNIIIVSKQQDINNSFSVITQDKNLVKKTVGQLLTGRYYHYPHFEGSSSLENNGDIFKDSIFTVKKTLNIEDMVDIKIKSNSFIIGEKGVTELYRGGMFVLDDNRINYLDPERELRIKNCKGMVVNPPTRRNSDVFYDALHYIENGREVLILLLDGFGFHQYKYAIKNGYAPFLAGFKGAQKALSVYKPVTNAGLAATLTGKGPEENGVYSRKQKDLATSDIFAEANELGAESLYIEGNIKILNTSIEPLLNPDLNKDGSTDDEVFSSALNNLDKNYNLIYVHFHGIDDLGHSYGDLDVKTMEKIRETDYYLKQLIALWSGKVIITADHGMHSTVNGGTHGMVRYEDLIVPYILAEGGSADE